MSNNRAVNYWESTVYILIIWMIKKDCAKGVDFGWKMAIFFKSDFEIWMLVYCAK